MNKFFVPIVSVICVLVLVLSHQFWIQADTQKPFDATTKGLFKLPRIEILKLSSMGYANTLADYLWINLILKIGQSNKLEEYAEHVLTEHSVENGHTHKHHFVSAPTLEDSLTDQYLSKHLPDIFYNYIDRITDLDPDFLYPYLVGFTFALQPEYHNPDAFKSLLKKGLERHSDYWEMNFFYAYYLFTIENAEDSLVLSYLRDSLNAPKSIRVFNKEIAYNTYVAFSQKMNKDVRNQVFMEGMMESLDNETLKQNIKSKIEQEKIND